MIWSLTFLWDKLRFNKKRHMLTPRKGNLFSYKWDHHLLCVQSLTKLIIYSDCKILRKEIFLDLSISPWQRRFKTRILNALTKMTKVEAFCKSYEAGTYFFRRAHSYSSNGQSTKFTDLFIWYFLYFCPLILPLCFCASGWVLPVFVCGLLVVSQRIWILAVSCSLFLFFVKSSLWVSSLSRVAYGCHLALI